MSSTFEPELLLEARGPVRIVTLNRPEALNAANEALLDAVVGVWRHIAADPEARAVVLTGAGRAFSAGGDMNHLRDVRLDRDKRRSEIDGARALVTEMVDF